MKIDLKAASLRLDELNKLTENHFINFPDGDCPCVHCAERRSLLESLMKGFTNARTNSDPLR